MTIDKIKIALTRATILSLSTLVPILILDWLTGENHQDGIMYCWGVFAATFMLTLKPYGET